jgi:hypothetical protein
VIRIVRCHIPGEDYLSISGGALSVHGRRGRDGRERFDEGKRKRREWGRGSESNGRPSPPREVSAQGVVTDDIKALEDRTEELQVDTDGNNAGSHSLARADPNYS